MNDSVKYVNYNQLFTRHHPKSFASSLHRFLPTKCKMFKRTFLQQNKDASQRRMHRIFTVSSPLCNTVSGASSWRPGGWHTTEERWLETRTHPRSAERRTVGRGKLPCSTAQHSTVQYSAVQEWEHGTMLDWLVMTGDPRWPRPGSNWKLQIGDQITSVTYNLYPGSSLQTPTWHNLLLIHSTFICLPHVQHHTCTLQKSRIFEYFWGRTNLQP